MGHSLSLGATTQVFLQRRRLLLLLLYLPTLLGTFPRVAARQVKASFAAPAGAVAACLPRHAAAGSSLRKPVLHRQALFLKVFGLGL